MKEEKGFFSEYKEQINEAITDLKTKGRRHKQIPNILTMLRLTAPIAILPAAILGNIPFIIGATAFFGLTDLADGFIARNWNLKSKLGADLDALADKIFAGTLLLAASVTNPLLLLNVGLEMAIAGINIKQKADGKEAASTLMGKIKTFSLFPLAGAGILSALTPIPTLVNALAVTTTTLQALTIGSYLKKYYTKPKQEKTEEVNEIEPVSFNAKEDEATKTKEKTIDPNEKNNNTPVLENPEVKRLREMKAFLLHEKEIKRPVVSQEPKVYRKK